MKVKLVVELVVEVVVEVEDATTLDCVVYTVNVDVEIMRAIQNMAEIVQIVVVGDVEVIDIVIFEEVVRLALLRVLTM